MLEYLVNENSKLTLCKNMNELKLSLYKKNPSLINIPKNSKITFGQMSPSKKINMDHRYIAFKKLKKKTKIF